MTKPLLTLAEYTKIPGTDPHLQEWIKQGLNDAYTEIEACEAELASLNYHPDQPFIKKVLYYVTELSPCVLALRSHDYDFEPKYASLYEGEKPLSAFNNYLTDVEAERKAMLAEYEDLRTYMGVLNDDAKDVLKSTETTYNRLREARARASQLKLLRQRYKNTNRFHKGNTPAAEPGHVGDL